MAKYQCRCGCGAVVETESDKVPACCGRPMKKVDDKAKQEKCGCCCCC